MSEKFLVRARNLELFFPSKDLLQRVLSTLSGSINHGVWVVSEPWAGPGGKGSSEHKSHVSHSPMTSVN